VVQYSVRILQGLGSDLLSLVAALTTNRGRSSKSAREKRQRPGHRIDLVAINAASFRHAVVAEPSARVLLQKSVNLNWFVHESFPLKTKIVTL
jgi:hypothetical protein